MSDQSWAAFIGFAVYVALRVVDYLLPKGRHFPFVDKYTHPDQNDDTGEDEKG